MSGRPETLTSELTPARLSLAPHLFLISNCDRPADNSQRLSLQGIEQLIIRRGDGEPASGSRVAVEGTGIEIHVADAWMSTTHATLPRIRGTWSLEGSGSRNGTLLNGSVIRRETLADGDLIETGHTFFLFRASLPSAIRATVLDAGSLRPAAPGLATLSPSLAATFTRSRRSPAARSRCCSGARIRRRQTRTLALALLLLVVLASGGVLWWQHRGLR